MGCVPAGVARGADSAVASEVAAAGVLVRRHHVDPRRQPRRVHRRDRVAGAAVDDQCVRQVFAADVGGEGLEVLALEVQAAHDEAEAVARMRAHLEGIRAVLLQWDEDTLPR